MPPQQGFHPCCGGANPYCGGAPWFRWRRNFSWQIETLKLSCRRHRRLSICQMMAMARTARLTAPDGGAGARRLRPFSLTKPKIMTHLRLQVWGIQGLAIYQIGGEYIILVGFVRESVILMTSRFTEFSISVRKVFLVARRIVTNENYCLFFLTNIGRNMQFSNAMEKSN